MADLVRAAGFLGTNACVKYVMFSSSSLVKRAEGMIVRLMPAVFEFTVLSRPPPGVSSPPMDAVWDAE